MRMGSWTGRSDLAIVSNGRRGHVLEDGPVTIVMDLALPSGSTTKPCVSPFPRVVNAD